MNISKIAVFPSATDEQTSSGTEQNRDKDNDGLHKRRGIWHTRVKTNGQWREVSLGTRN